MSTPSPVTLINKIVTLLKDDSRLSAISDEFIYFGNDGIANFPAVTVELREEREQRATLPKGMNAIYSLVITVYDESVDYATGLQSIHTHAKNISDILQSNISVGSLVYYSNIERKRYGPGMYGKIPVFACEIEFTATARFVQAT